MKIVIGIFGLFAALALIRMAGVGASSRGVGSPKSTRVGGAKPTISLTRSGSGVLAPGRLHPVTAQKMAQATLLPPSASMPRPIPSPAQNPSTSVAVQPVAPSHLEILTGVSRQGRSADPGNFAGRFFGSLFRLISKRRAGGTRLGGSRVSGATLPRTKSLPTLSRSNTVTRSGSLLSLPAKVNSQGLPVFTNPPAIAPQGFRNLGDFFSKTKGMSTEAVQKVPLRINVGAKQSGQTAAFTLGTSKHALPRTGTVKSTDYITDLNGNRIKVQRVSDAPPPFLGMAPKPLDSAAKSPSFSANGLSGSKVQPLTGSAGSLHGASATQSGGAIPKASRPFNRAPGTPPYGSPQGSQMSLSSTGTMRAGSATPKGSGSLSRASSEGTLVGSTSDLASIDPAPLLSGPWRDLLRKYNVDPRALKNQFAPKLSRAESRALHEKAGYLEPGPRLKPAARRQTSRSSSPDAKRRRTDEAGNSVAGEGKGPVAAAESAGHIPTNGAKRTYAEVLKGDQLAARGQLPPVTRVRRTPNRYIDDQLPEGAPRYPYGDPTVGNVLPREVIDAYRFRYATHPKFVEKLDDMVRLNHFTPYQRDWLISATRLKPEQLLYRLRLSYYRMNINLPSLFPGIKGFGATSLMVIGATAGGYYLNKYLNEQDQEIPIKYIYTFPNGTQIESLRAIYFDPEDRSFMNGYSNRTHTHNPEDPTKIYIPRAGRDAQQFEFRGKLTDSLGLIEMYERLENRAMALARYCDALLDEVAALGGSMQAVMRHVNREQTPPTPAMIGYRLQFLAKMEDEVDYLVSSPIPDEQRAYLQEQYNQFLEGEKLEADRGDHDEKYLYSPLKPVDPASLKTNPHQSQLDKEAKVLERVIGSLPKAEFPPMHVVDRGYEDYPDYPTMGYSQGQQQQRHG